MSTAWCQEQVIKSSACEIVSDQSEGRKHGWRNGHVRGPADIQETRLIIGIRMCGHACPDSCDVNSFS